MAASPLIRREALTAVQKALANSGQYHGRILRLAKRGHSTPAGPPGYISQRAFADYLDTLATEARDPHLGARVGLATDWRDMSLLGWATLNSPTIGIGLHNCMRYQHTWRQAATIHIKEDARTARWTICYGDALVGATRQEPERALGSAVSVLRRLISPDWSPVEVWFEHPQMADGTEYRRLFGAPVRFSQPETGLILDRAVLDYPTPNADPRLLGVLESYVPGAAPADNTDDDLLVALREAIRAELDQGAPAMPVLAARLGMTPRTLQRRLQARGVQFGALLDRTRYELAAEFLRAKELTITEIALQLGYANLPAFDRAFKRWSGKTPVAYRQERGFTA